MRSLFNSIRVSWHQNTNTHCCCCWEKKCAWFCVQNKGRGSFYQQNFHATIPILNHATFLLTFSQQQQSRRKKTYVKVRIHSAIMGNGLLTLILKLFSGYEAILDSDSFFRIASYPVNNFRTNVSKPLADMKRSWKRNPNPGLLHIH